MKAIAIAMTILIYYEEDYCGQTFKMTVTGNRCVTGWCERVMPHRGREAHYLHRLR
jgi:hypothetical protein